MNWVIVIIVLATIDILGRIAALVSLMNNGEVKKLKYRTWVIISALINFAWVFYFIIGRGKKNV